MLGFIKGRASKPATREMGAERIGNYVLTHRKRAGLSQSELGRLIGYGGKGSVSRHEKSLALPPLATALCYEAIFGVPVSDLFPGLKLTVRQAVEDRISEFERELQTSSGVLNGQARKLAWLDERRAMLEA